MIGVARNGERDGNDAEENTRKEPTDDMRHTKLVHIHTCTHERPLSRLGQRWAWFGGYHEDGSHRVYVVQGRVTLDHLDASDRQRPNISLPVIRNLEREKPGEVGMSIHRRNRSSFEVQAGSSGVSACGTKGASVATTLVLDVTCLPFFFWLPRELMMEPIVRKTAEQPWMCRKSK